MLSTVLLYFYIAFSTIEVKKVSAENITMVTEVEHCKQIVAKLQREKVIAMATEGINVGKEGPLTLIQIGTCSGLVFVFDILLKRELVEKGRLRWLLEDNNVTKVTMITLKKITNMLESVNPCS